MTSGSRFRYSLYVNPFMYLRDNDLISNPLEAPIKSSDSLAPIFRTLFCGLTLSPAPVSALPIDRYINEDLQRAIKLALKLFLQG